MRTTPTAPTIRQLSIARFRGIRALTWKPDPGVNMVLGGGDAGKSTILEAVALLLSPVTAGIVTDVDYYGRVVEEGFEVEAFLSIPTSNSFFDRARSAWPWSWDGDAPTVPSPESSAADPVFCFRVRGTADLELVYEIVEPDGSTDPLSVASRRAIGLVRLGGDDRNDRDLRLVQGSALDRLLSDPGLRSRVTNEFAQLGIVDALDVSAAKALEDLDASFKKRNLPDKLNLAITGGNGLSVSALVGLTAHYADGVHLPLASWGSGTRRLAALAIAEQHHGNRPITIVDEIERGLEPYRQQALIERLQDSGAQVFLTTHSPSAIVEASSSSIWYVDHLGAIGALDGKKISRLRERDPLAFLSRLTIVAEGVTEVGFVSVLLERALGGRPSLFGIRISDGGGHESTLGVLEALEEGGLSFGGFADNEKNKHPSRWAALENSMAGLLMRWPAGCIEENIFAATSDDKLEALMVDPLGKLTGMRRASLAMRLGSTARSFQELAEIAGNALRSTMIDAALGQVPSEAGIDEGTYESHARTWFKHPQGGRELAGKVFRLGLWNELRDRLLPFCNAVRVAAGLESIDDIPIK